MKLQVFQGDITQLRVDAIVNAANSTLLGGGGVDGAIHRAAGPGLLEECRHIEGGCRTGEAVITLGYRLPAPYVIHTVGPVWRGGKANESRLLENCYRNAIRLAHEREIRTIAFPNISTGVYGFPRKRALEIVAGYFLELQKSEQFIEEVLFVCFDRENYRMYREKFSGSGSTENL